MNKDEIKKFPLPIINAYREYEREENFFRKVHRLIDLIEVYLKFHTVIIMNRYFELEDISDTVKDILIRGLKRPSLGIWWMFTRELSKELKDKETDSVLKEMMKMLLGKGKIFKLMEGQDNLISFRNSYAHGVTPSEKRCEAEIKKYGEKFFSVFIASDYLKDMKIVCSNRNKLEFSGNNIIKIEERVNEDTCYLKIGEDISISLYPLLVLNEEDDKIRFYFYNDIKNSFANILNYKDCIHKKEKELLEIILEKFPIEEWRKGEIKVEDKFRERIDLLTETFKGRKNELQEIVDFLSKKSGEYLMIWGGPGVGKSALLARAVQMLSWSEEIRKEAGIKGGIGKDKLYIFEYFIRRDMGTNDGEEFLDYMYRRLFNKFKIEIKAGKSVKEKKRAYIEQLKLISKGLKDDERIVLIIDGLDEGAEKPELLDSLVREYIDKVLVVYASRENTSVREYVYDQLERERHREMTLGGLSSGDTRALLYEYVNKYELEDKYVEALREKSDGNPLYIKLVCHGIQDGIYKLNDSFNLPKGLEEIYEKLIKNYHKIDKSGKFFDLLMILVAGKDFFSADMISQLMKIKTVEAKHTLDIVMEVLIENPLTEEVLDYQVFHESLREYLSKRYKTDLKEWNEKICEWLRGWKDLRNESLDYAMKYFFHHFEDLYRAYREDEKFDKADELYKYLMETVDNEAFRDRVFELVGNDSSLRYGFKLLQKIIMERDTDGKEMDRFFRYSRMINEEKEIRTKKQFERMLREARNENLENTANLAKMGKTIRESLLFVLRTIWEAPESTRLPLETKKITEKWVKELSEPVFEELMKLSFKRFID